jgi:dCMP deaminase
VARARAQAAAGQAGSALRPRRRSAVKDGRPENTHPLNRGPGQDRIPLYESFLRFAEALARCSPAAAHRTGCVLVSFNLERVLGAGFSGGAASARGRLGGARRRDSHLHAEEHALLIAGAVEKDKLMFVTEAPCLLCAARAINSGVSHVYYRTATARGCKGLELLRRAGKAVIHYPRWRPRSAGPHPIGLVGGRLPPRMTLPEAYQHFAEALALRSTDGSQKVGCVVVSGDLERVLGIGYNGGAAGIDDRDFIPADRSGYVHAEENALLKAGAIEKDKVMFLTHTPCVMCAKRAINSGVARIHCRQPNQRGDAMGLALLQQAGKQVVWWKGEARRR